MQALNLRTIALILINALLFTGCASSKDKLFPQDGPTMLEIYETHLDRVGMPPGRGDSSPARTVPSDSGGVIATGLTPVSARGPGGGAAELVGYTRTAYNEIEVLFPRLENPTLVMYVFPHLAGKENMPVPGYATAFTMYERTEFALPGEIRRRSSAAPRRPSQEQFRSAYVPAAYPPQ